MDKVICDICGTSYPESSEKCPICGCSRDFSLDTSEFDGFTDSAAAETEHPRKKNREIFDYDEVNHVRQPRRDLDEDDFDDEDDDEYEEETSSNTALVVILVILIVLLLLSAGFLFIRYFLPNMKEEPVVTEPVIATMPVETEAQETTEPTIPCTNLMVDGGKVELGKDGKHLMNVHVYPEDTTDELSFRSENEAVVTVTEDGTVTAVGEGETVILVVCGNQQINYKVTVDFSIGAETVPEGEVPAMQVEETGATEETVDAPAETEDTSAAEETKPEETTAGEGSGDTTLKLKKPDITIFSIYTSVTLELDCDVKPEEIYWFTMDSTVAIVNNGVVTSTGSGMTRIYGEYEGQRVECIVRCQF